MQTTAPPHRLVPRTLPRTHSSSPVPIGHTGLWSTGSIVGTLTLPLFSNVITWVRVPCQQVKGLQSPQQPGLTLEEAKTEGGPGVTDQAPLLRHLLSAAPVCEHGGLPRSLRTCQAQGRRLRIQTTRFGVHVDPSPVCPLSEAQALEKQPRAASCEQATPGSTPGLAGQEGSTISAQLPGGQADTGTSWCVRPAPAEGQPFPPPSVKGVEAQEAPVDLHDPKRQAHNRASLPGGV